MVDGLAPKFLRDLTSKLDLDDTLELDGKRNWSEVIEESLDPFFMESETPTKLLDNE